QQGGEYRAQLANETEPDHRPERLFRTEADEGVVALQTEHHTDRDAADADDHQRQHAEIEELGDEQPDPARRRERGAHDGAGEEGDAAEMENEADDGRPDVPRQDDHGAGRGVGTPSRVDSPDSPDSSNASFRKPATRGSGLRNSVAGGPATACS